MTYREISSPEELAAWLSSSGIDTSGWGQGATKTVADLWNEYAGGESVFEDDPPARLVEVAQVIIRRGDAILLEFAQEFADGRRRERLQLPSEKLKRGESPQDAARRCLNEELGLGAADARLAGPERVEQQEQVSPSYPGLPTRYRFYVFSAETDALPDGDFSRDNAVPDDPVRRHHWGWLS